MVNIGSQSVKSFTELVNSFLVSSMRTAQVSNISKCHSVQNVDFDIGPGGEMKCKKIYVGSNTVCDMTAIFSQQNNTNIKQLLQNAIDKAIEQDSKQDSGMIGFLTANLSMSSQEVTNKIKNLINNNLSEETLHQVLQEASVDQNIKITVRGKWECDETIVQNQLNMTSKVVTNLISDIILSDAAINSVIEKDKQKDDQKSEGISSILSSFGFLLIIIIAGVLGFVYFVLPTLTEDNNSSLRPKKNFLKMN